MLKLLKLISSNNILINILVASLISLLCWIVLPHISIAGNYPFASELIRFSFVSLITILTIIKIVIGYIIKYKLTTSDQIKKYVHLSKMNASSGFEYLKLRSIEMYDNAHDFFRKDPGPRLFKKLPIYIVMGSEKSGKKSLIQNAGLRLLPASYFGRKANQLIDDHSAYKFYFSDQGIYIICSDNFSHDIKSFSKLLKYLRKRRSYKPISGLILLFSIPELMLAKHDDRKHFIQNVDDQIQLMYRYLKTSIPLYCLFTKLDLVHGFTEFFNHLSKDELMQLWGITFPLAISNQLPNLESYFEVGYDQLISRLDAQLAQILDIEKDQDKQRSIYIFPAQMQLFKNPLKGFVKELFSGLHNHKILQIRGVYLTSASQMGDSYDFIAHAMNAQFDLEPPKKKSIIESHESYFIYQLFQSVILKECEYVGYSLKMNTYRKWFYRLLVLGVPLLIITTAWTFHKIYTTSINMNAQINSNLDFYDQEFKNLDMHDLSENQALNLLNPLLQSEKSIQNKSMLNWIFSSNDSYLNSIQSALDRTLASQFMPRVAANLEKTLNQSQLDTNTLYATLKGYLAFSPQADTSASSVIAPMMILWEKSYAPDSTSLLRLKYYLDRSATFQVVALPIDRPLVNRVRLSLQQVVPSDRAYALLSIKSMASNLPDIVLSSLAGESFSSVFEISDRDDSIPALFTAVGFKRLFQDNLDDIATQVAQDNKEIGLQSNIERTESFQSIIREMQMKYNSDYQAQWKGLLQHIQLKPISNCQQAQQVFQVLSESDSPLDRLMHIISENTQNIQSVNITVSDHFKSINQFSDSSFTGSSLNSADNAFNSLNAILTKILQSSNPPESALDYIQSFPKLGSSDPFKQIAHLAQNAPLPVQQWLNNLSHQAWEAISNEALIALNQKWNDQVAVYYQQHLSDHYPIDKSSDRDLSIDNFSEFYKNAGIYDIFYKQYIAEFIDTSDESTIRLKSYNGYTFSFSDNDLQFFEKSNRIVKDYFNSDGKANINFSLKPVSLDKDASEFNLMIGDHPFSYAHGPEELVHYQWPFDLNQSSVDLSVTGFSNEPNHLNADGAWALLTIFSHAQINKTKDGYLMEYRLGNLNFSWVCDSDTPVRALNLGDFTSLNFPAGFTLR